MKELIIHIGLPKTGTTTIQSSLKNNAKLLFENGISFFDLHLFGNSTHDSLWCNLLYKGEISDGRELRIDDILKRKSVLPSLEECFSKLYNESQDKIIMSSERMTVCRRNNSHIVFDLSSVREIVSFCNNSQQFKLSQIIIYIRRQDYFYDSMRNQEIKEKGGTAATFDLPDFNEKLNELNDFLVQFSPATKFDVRNFDLAVKTGLEQDFYNCIGLSNFEPLSNTTNVSVTAEELLLSTMYTDCISTVKSIQETIDFKYCRELIKEFSGDLRKRKVLFLTAERKMALLDQAYEGNQSIFKRFKMGSSKEFNEWMSVKPEKVDTVYFDSDDRALNKSAKESLLSAFVNLGGKISDNDITFIANSFLNVIRFNQDKSVYIFGCGEHTSELLHKVGLGMKISGIIDQSPTQEALLGIKVHLADDFDYSQADIIIISSKVFEEHIYLYLKTKVSVDKIVTLYGSSQLRIHE